MSYDATTSTGKYALALHDNPQPRCPVVLLLDVSTSMTGKPISELREGVEQFFSEIAGDAFARLSVEAAVVTYGSEVKTAVPFHSAADGSLPRTPDLEAIGCTPMGAAIDKGLSMLGERRDSYRKAGVSSYKPWLVLMTDGQPNDDWEGPAARARKQAEDGKLVFFGVGIGPDADMDLLAEALPSKQPPTRMRGLRFKSFFKWLSDSLRSVSRDSVESTPEATDPGEWADPDWTWDFN